MTNDPYQGQQPYDPYQAQQPDGQSYGQQPYDPYAGQQPYGQPGHGAQPPPGYPVYPGYGPPAAPPDEGPKGQAVGALVANIASLLCCWPIAIGGIIVSIVAVVRCSDSPDSARRLLKWAWGLLIATVSLGVLATVGYVVLFVILETS